MKRLMILLALSGAIGASYAAQVHSAGPRLVSTTTASPIQFEDTWPDWLQNWIDNGGPMPDALVSDVIHAAAGWGMSTLHLTEAEMLTKYNAGSLLIDFDRSALPRLTFRVSAGNTGISVILDDY